MIIYIKQLLTAIFWGGTFIAARAAAQHVPAFSLAFIRFAITTVLLILLGIYAREKIQRPNLKQFIAVSILGLFGIFIYNVCFFKGLKDVEAGRASLIIATVPIFITIASALFLEERIKIIQVLGILISVTGAMVVISKGDISVIIQEGLGKGEFYIFGCVACWTLYSTISKNLMVNFSPLSTACWSSAIGAVGLFFPAFHEGVFKHIIEMPGSVWLHIGYLAVFGSVIGFVWYNQGVKKIGPTKAGIFINIIPISAMILAYFILDEPITIQLFIGAALVISGVLLTTQVKSLLRSNDYPPHKKKPPLREL